MSKSGAPSASASASASASSHDPHSLPPNVKGLIQRYLAVSLPTITLTPELIDVLDRSEVIIPSRIQVTMRWWKEDSTCSLSVYPKLNSPLPEPIERRQSLLRQRQQQKRQEHNQQRRMKQDQQEQHGKQERGSWQQVAARRRSPIHDPTNLMLPHAAAQEPAAQPSTLFATATQPQPRSLTPSFLRRPWPGARLLGVFRKGKSKSKEHKARVLAAAEEADKGAPVLVDAVEWYPPTPTYLSADANADTEPDAKPLPSLPDAAYPITVAYPIRCALEQLRRYFVEMTSLTLEIQITPTLSILAFVPNLTDLFRNINGTFSGVFPFSTVLQNDDPRFRTEKLFQKRVVLGMVVFQAWSQDTSDVGDSSEESDSISTNSVLALLAENAPDGAARHSPYAHHRHLSHQTHQGHQPSQRQRAEFPSGPYAPPLQYSYPSQHPQPAMGPAHSFGPRHDTSAGTGRFANPGPTPQAQWHHGGRVAHLPHTLAGPAPAGRRPPFEDVGYGHRISWHFDGGASNEDHIRRPSRLQGGVDDSNYSHDGHDRREHGQRFPGDRLSHSSKYRAAQIGGIAGNEATRTLRPYAGVRIPAPVTGLQDEPLSYHVRHDRVRSPVDGPLPEDTGRRSEDTNATNSLSQSARSRPRSGATAAAIGRLNSVLSRGENLLHGMRTSLALDPEEVRAMSARNIRSSAVPDDFDEDRFTPYHEVLPYWPTKSRFSLEMSIPTAYLTSRGLLKGSQHKKYSSVPTATSIPSRHSASQRREFEYPEGLRAHNRQSPLPGSSMVGQGEPQRRSNPSQQYPREVANRTRQPWAEPGAGVALGSTPRPLRRSGRPIQFEKPSARSDLARLRLAQEESMRPHYQSFQTGNSSSGLADPSFPRERLQPTERQQQQAHQPRSQATAQWPPQEGQDRERHFAQQPRKSKSYPPPSSSQDESRGSRINRRRLSSNDRLQIRMNPKAGDMLNYIPDLFPARSMSALLVPEYRSSRESSSISTGNSSSIGTEDDDLSRAYGFAEQRMGGRQSRLQKRPHRSYRHHPDLQHAKRHQSQRNHHQPGASGQSQKRGARGDRVYPQHFNFKVNCQLQLTPEVMAACMVENISIEVWKLNSKRQTMIELGSAKLPLHKVLSRIMQKTAVMTPAATSNAQARHHREPRARADAEGYRARATREGFKEGWRLEPSVYDIRSRQGTIVGQLDADVWIHPRSRSDSMVSAAA